MPRWIGFFELITLIIAGAALLIGSLMESKFFGGVWFWIMIGALLGRVVVVGVFYYRSQRRFFHKSRLEALADVLFWSQITSWANRYSERRAEAIRRGDTDVS